MKIYLKLLISIVIPQLAGIIGSLFTTPAIPTWYAGLTKAPLNPPAWVFGPVWTILFLLMGIAAFLVWNKLGNFQNREGIASVATLPRNDTQIKASLGIFIIQLVLNTFWSIIFFGLHSPGAALAEIVFLWLAILATIIAFSKISKPAAWLLAPYIVWVSFAIYLNYMVWALN